MTQFFGILVFIFGVIIGSFLNVVILRYKTGRNVSGRSFCFSCGKNLSAFELIPLVSFVFQMGKCKGCNSKVSWQYPLVELLSGLVFLVVFMKIADAFPFVSVFSLPFYWFAFSLLIVISVYDIRHKIVPDMLAFIFAFTSLLWILGTNDIVYFTTYPGLFNLFAGPLLFLPFFFLWLISKGEWMGLGDGKLAIGIGWFLGFTQGISAIILGFWIAAFVSLVLLAFQRWFHYFFHSRIPFLSMKTEVPFAPFLALGTLLAFYFSPDFLSLNVLFGI